ncbi:hypothetical protein J1N35_026285 [Gossypium stocksii]|uniref:Uncharacterized protein n=1 Tax=Gossypium stocksii TaxID=47602 RepID=A0A9D3V817_9ROSI|nr:hypothetical protein J1N35_026285 [Gossypium stocksii]
MRRDDALEAMMMTLKEKIAELKGELTIYKVALGNAVFVVASKPNVDAPSQKNSRGQDKLKSSKPKFKPNGNVEGYKDKSVKNGDGNTQTFHKSKFEKPWEKKKRGLLTHFLCDGPYMVRDYLEKSTVSAIEGDDESDKIGKRTKPKIIGEKAKLPISL